MFCYFLFCRISSNNLITLQELILQFFGFVLLSYKMKDVSADMVWIAVLRGALSRYSFQIFFPGIRVGCHIQYIRIIRLITVILIGIKPISIVRIKRIPGYIPCSSYIRTFRSALCTYSGLSIIPRCSQ